MTLETKIKEMTADLPEDKTFTVIAWEMWRDECGWSVNDGWKMRSDADKGELPEIVRNRWEVIAENYGRPRVSGLTDIGYTPEVLQLESDCFPIVEIRVNED